MNGAALVGLSLVAGSILFLVGAFDPALFRVWTAPDEVQLRLIHERRRAWMVANTLFVAGTVLTTAALLAVPDRLGADAAALGRLAGTTYLLAAVAWLLSLVFRLSVTPVAATTFVSTGVVDPTYDMLRRWSSGMFATFTILAGISIVALGLAVLLGGALPVLLGWTMVILGAVIVGGFVVAGDMPPFVAYLPTAALGVSLLVSGS